MFVPDKPFQLSVMFVGKAGAYPIQEPFRCYTLGQNTHTRLERLTRDKHSSLLRKFVNFGQKKFCVCPWQAFPTSLIFVGKARSLPLIGAPERHFTKVGSCLTCKLSARLERLAKDKCSSLLWKGITEAVKSFITLGPGCKNVPRSTSSRPLRIRQRWRWTGAWCQNYKTFLDIITSLST